MHVVILAAGIGSRLGRSLPKSLTRLVDGRTIMRQQIENIHSVFGTNQTITTVVGYRAEEIVERYPDNRYVYNERYDQNNTSKSLLRALKQTPSGGVVWLNGDVVFDPFVLARALPLIEADHSFVAVDRTVVGAEEVKYSLDSTGHVRELSKTVSGALGEAVGVNFIAAHDRPSFEFHLGRCDDNDYFERGIELAIAADAMRVSPLDISDLYAVEVDFHEDLTRANSHV